MTEAELARLKVASLDLDDRAMAFLRKASLEVASQAIAEFKEYA